MELVPLIGPCVQALSSAVRCVRAGDSRATHGDSGPTSIWPKPSPLALTVLAPKIKVTQTPGSASMVFG